MATVTYHPAVPLHHQIQSVLRSKIESGEWAIGERIPTEMELVQRFRVSRSTVRGALKSLVRDGLIDRHKRHGTFVRERIQAARRSTMVSNPVFGYRAQIRVVKAETVPAPPHVAPLLGVKREVPLGRLVRVEVVGGVPLAVVVNYMSPDLAQRIRAEDLTRYWMLEILRDRLKIALGVGRQVIEARMPDDEVASLLGTDLTQPVLYMRMLISDRRGRPIEVADMFYRCDRYRYEREVSLARPSSVRNRPKRRRGMAGRGPVAFGEDSGAWRR